MIMCTNLEEKNYHHLGQTKLNFVVFVLHHLPTFAGISAYYIAEVTVICESKTYNITLYNQLSCIAIDCHETGVASTLKMNGYTLGKLMLTTLI